MALSVSLFLIEEFLRYLDKADSPLQKSRISSLVFYTKNLFGSKGKSRLSGNIAHPMPDYQEYNVLPTWDYYKGTIVLNNYFIFSTKVVRK